MASLLAADSDREKFLYDLGVHGDPVASRIRIDQARQSGERFEGEAYGLLARLHIFSPSPLDRVPPVTVLDPTAGGGSIPFESARLNCRTIANDLNPVATLILKATLELPLSSSGSLSCTAASRVLAAEFVRRRDQILQELLPAGTIR